MSKSTAVARPATTVASCFRTLTKRPSNMSPAKWAWHVSNPKSITNTSTKASIIARRQKLIDAKMRRAR